MPTDPWEEAAKEFKRGGSPSQAATPSANDDWKIWQSSGDQSKPTESRGFLGELWNEVKNGPANLLQVGNAINNAVAHPVDTFNAMGQQIEGTAKKAKEAWQSGDYKKATREALNTGINAVVPGMGTSSSEAGEMFDRGDTAGGLGKTAGIGVNAAIGAKTPQIMQKVAEAPQAIGNLTKVDPRVAINRALRPAPRDPNFPQRVPGTVAAIKKANAGEAPAGITNGKLDLIDAANKAIADHQAVLGKWLARAKGVRVNGDELVAATRDAIPQMMWERDPGAAQGLIQDAQGAFGGKTYTVEQFRDFLKSENGDLSAFYKKTPGAQSDAAVAGTPTAIQEAQTQRIRDVLYKALDPEGGGVGPRAIQNKTGDLIKMRDAASARNNAIVAEQPLTPIGKVIDPIKAGVRAVLPGKATGAGIAFAEGSEGRSLPYIKRAFKAVGDDPVNELPLPASPLYPTVLVPVVNPVTGRTEYVPRNPPQFAKGGIAGLNGPEEITVGDGGEPEVVVPLSHIRMMGSQAQHHLLRGIGVHLGIGEHRRSSIGAAIGEKGRAPNFQEKKK